MTRMPSNPNVPRSSAAEDRSDRMPSGSGPVAAAEPITGSSRRTVAGSPDSAATHAATCAASGFAWTVSPPTAVSQPRTVSMRPALRYGYQ